MATPLPPGMYQMTITRIRKVRNKPYYRVHFITSEGHVSSYIMRMGSNGI